jgi:hypothetical protein
MVPAVMPVIATLLDFVYLHGFARRRSLARNYGCTLDLRLTDAARAATDGLWQAWTMTKVRPACSQPGCRRQRRAASGEVDGRGIPPERVRFLSSCRVTARVFFECDGLIFLMRQP